MSFWHVFVVTFILVLPLTLLVVPPLELAWRRRHEAKRQFLPRRTAMPMIVPSADETAASIERFQTAVRRFQGAESKWEALTETASGAILRRQPKLSPGEPR